MAQQAIEAGVSQLGTRLQPLADCIGQILREDIYAERDNPPFDRVCMDGIAIDSGSLTRGHRRFRVQAAQGAGAPALQLANLDQAIEVMTGAVLPVGADCVIPLEEYIETDGVVTLNDDASGARFRNVQRRGEDSRPGSAMLSAGIRLAAPEIAVAASAGRPSVYVSRQPRFTVISTGNELIDPGKPIAEYQIRRSNVYAIIAALRARHFDDVQQDHVIDDERLLRERLQAHLNTRDILILSGGVSKGRFDYVPKVLKDLGVREIFHQVAQKPGMPMWFGRSDAGCAVYGLPGNPVATLVCLVRYVVPAALAAMGLRPRAAERVALAAAIAASHPTFASFLPVCLEYDAVGPHAATRPTKGSGDFLSLATTDGFVELPPSPDGFAAGFVADLYRW